MPNRLSGKLPRVFLACAISLLFAGFVLAEPVQTLVPQLQSMQETRTQLNDINQALQATNAGWTTRVSSVSQLTFEGKRQLAGLLPKPDRPSFLNKKYQQADMAALASSTTFDWRNHDGHSYVTPVKNQGQCGSCWAFAVTAALESHALITGQTPDQALDLSDQIVVSCSRAGSCGGGWPDQASNFLARTGTADAKYYPYTARNGACSRAYSGWKDQSYKLQSWQYVVQNAVPTVTMLKNALADTGPLVATMQVYEDFYYYGGGVYRHVSGRLVGGHVILIVGWNDDDQAFIVKNSWGTRWGKDGYFEIAYSELGRGSRLGNEVVLSDGPVTIPGSAH